MRAERTVSVPRGGTRSQAGGGREENGQGTCNVPARGRLRQWATGPGRHRSGSSVENLQFQTGSLRKRPADQGRDTGTGLPGLLRAGPEPANRSAAPPTKLRILPDTPTSCPCCYGSADGSQSRGGLAGGEGLGAVERFPSFLWSLRASP